MPKPALSLVCLLMMFGIMTTAPAAEEKEMVVEKGKKVSFEYTLTVDGNVVDSSEGRAPLTYTHGQGQIISGLASRMEGLKTGDERIIEVPPEEGYGRAIQDALKEIPKTALPEGLDLKPGMFLEMQGPGGQALPVRVSEVKDDTIVLDLNHPLAGKTLTFDVKIVAIE